MAWLTMVAVVIAVAAAARSTWSPCGLSMLSTITPGSEAGRGHRYSVTAAWFVLGSVAGGATLGGAAALLAAAVAALGPSARVTVALGALAAMAAAGGDAGLAGVRFPVFRRQVDERWLDQYRSWFYGAGFGWQVGVGVATYIMTAGVFLTVVLAALTANPLTALLVCTAFGVVRGLSVLLTRRLHAPEGLRAFHRRFDRLSNPSRLGTIAVELAAGLVLVTALWAPAAAVVALAVVAAVVLGRSPRKAGRRSSATDASGGA